MPSAAPPPPVPAPAPPPAAPPAPPAPMIPLQIAHPSAQNSPQSKGRGSLRIDRSSGGSSAEGAGLNLPS